MGIDKGIEEAQNHDSILNASHEHTGDQVMSKGIGTAKSCSYNLPRSRIVAKCCFLFFGTSSSLPSRSRLQTISKALAVLQAMEGARNSFFPDRRQNENRNATVPTSRLDFLKALAKRGRTCSNSIASRKADRVDAHQVRIKATHTEPTPSRLEGKALYGPAVVY